MVQWNYVYNFQAKEFDSKDAPGTGNFMHPALIYRLDALRCLVGCPFIINSGYRTAEHNRRVGGAPNSAHLTGLAVDISTRWMTKGEKKALIEYARKLEFTGIGIARTFIHLDMKPRIASWVYRGKRIEGIPVGEEHKHL